MGKTPILQLETNNSTTDTSQKFLTYRMNQNGDINSNMTKIDGWADTVNKKVKELQDRVSTVLLNANWVSLGYYEATTLEVTELKANMLFTIRLNKDNDGVTTIKVNGLTTKSLLKCDSSGLLVNLASGDLKKNKEYQFRYDGTSFIWQSGVSGDQVNVSGVSGDIITISADNTIEDSGIKAEQINTNKDTIGNKETLETTEKTNLVGAINEVEGKRVILSEDVGNKANLQTDDKTNLVSAINEVKQGVDGIDVSAQVASGVNIHNEGPLAHIDIRNSIGDISDLTTTEKENLVGAINEVKSQSNEIATDITKKVDKDKLPILCTPLTGYKINSEKSFQIGDVVYYNISISKEDGSAFLANTQFLVLNVPVGKIIDETVGVCMGYSGVWNVGGAVIFATNRNIFLTVFQTCTVVRIRGVAVL